MSRQLILWECSTCLKAVFAGMILASVYYMLRIFRRIIPHRIWLINLEDLLFWMASGVVLFVFIYRTSSGIIRAFQIGGFIAGAVLFSNAFGKPLIAAFEKVKMFIRKMKGKSHETGNKKGKSS